jgi:hypothetical protein
MKETKQKKGPKPRYKGGACKRQSISMPDEMVEWLRAQAIMQGTSMSMLVQNMVAKYMAERSACPFDPPCDDL